MRWADLSAIGVAAWAAAALAAVPDGPVALVLPPVRGEVLAPHPAPALVPPARRKAGRTIARPVPLRSARARSTSPSEDLMVRPEDVLPATREPPVTAAEEWIVALRLVGPRGMRILEVEDFDVLVVPSLGRLWPLLRFLDAVGEDAEVTAGVKGPETVSFFPRDRRRVRVSVTEQTVTFGDETSRTTMIRRWSPFTHRVEVYVPEHVFQEAFGYEIRWDEPTLTLTVETPVYPEWYLQKLRSKRIEWRNIQEVPPNLPEKFGPAQPPETGVQFVELSFTGRYAAREDLEERDLWIYRPRQRVWGRAAEGAFRFDLSERGWLWGSDRTLDEPRVLVERMWWQHSGDRYRLSVGDAELSLDELVFPSAPMTGVRWGMGSGASRRATEITVEDEAPLDSQVDLYLNDRFVASLRVRDPLRDRQGMGFFRFEGITLIPGRANEIRLVITEPTGIRRERVRTVWGEAGRLAPGEVSFLGGAGTFRRKDRWENHGVFAGGSLGYGLGEAVRLDLIGAYQARFLRPEFRGERGEVLGETFLPAPEESIHAGVGVTWIPGGLARFRTDLAYSTPLKGGRNPDWGVRLTGEVRKGAWRWRGDGFRLGSEFFDGWSVVTRDRLGAWTSLAWDPLPGYRLYGGLGTVRNNLDGARDETLRENIERIELTLGRLLPRTRLSLAADYIQQLWEGGGNQSLYSTQIDAWPFANVDVSWRMYVGDRLNVARHSDLVDDIRLLELPFYRDPYNGGQVRWGLWEGGAMYASHWNFQTRKQSQVGISLRGQGRLRWDLQSELGKDWDPEASSLVETLVWRGRLSLYPTRSTSRRVSLSAVFRRDRWSLVGSFNVLELFGFRGAQATWLTGRRISPDAGCVLGKVFLDRNGDGLRQPGEPGVPGVQVKMGRLAARTDADGGFVFPRGRLQERGRVVLDVRVLDALYTPTNAVREVEWAPGAVTSVDLGVAVAGAVLGKVEMETPEGRRPLPGVWVGLFDEEGVRVGRSLTASDGTFYIGEVLPGGYWVRVEEESVPPGWAVQTPPQRVRVVSGEDLPEETRVDFLVVHGGQTDDGEG